jgi:hypothetical protein
MSFASLASIEVLRTSIEEDPACAPAAREPTAFLKGDRSGQRE